jgi:hypothetical protein
LVDREPSDKTITNSDEEIPAELNAESVNELDEEEYDSESNEQATDSKRRRKK